MSARIPAENRTWKRQAACPSTDLVRNGALVDLNTLIPANSGFTIGGNPPPAQAGTVRINDSGQILCTAKTAAGVYHAVLLTPK